MYKDGVQFHKKTPFANLFISQLFLENQYVNTDQVSIYRFYVFITVFIVI
jgi:hypothetical protein